MHCSSPIRTLGAGVAGHGWAPGPCEAAKRGPGGWDGRRPRSGRSPSPAAGTGRQGHMRAPAGPGAKGRLAWLLLAACGALAHAGDPDAALVKDRDLGFLLSNLRVIKEVRDVGVPALSIRYLRLVVVPDRSDRCSWISRIPNLSSAEIEEGCPRDNLYLVFVSDDRKGGYHQNYRFRGQHVYHVGLGLFWRFIGMETVKGEPTVVLRLEATQIVNGKTRKWRPVAIELSRRGDGYSVSSRTEPP